MKSEDRNNLPDIVFVASNDFGTLWYQRQALAVLFAEAGYRVFYFNKTPQRWPGLLRVAKWLLKKSQKKKPAKNHCPENLKIVNPLWLVPYEKLRFINRRLIKKTLSRLDIGRNCVFITDVPSYNSLEVISQLRPKSIIYSNVHNYDDSSRIASSIAESESILIRCADVLFATSEYNAERIVRISGGRKVHRSLPGVDYKLFSSALRGDEAAKAESICFFGTVYDMVDVELYNSLSKKFRIVFIGDIADNVKNLISPNIEIVPAVGQNQLVSLLRDIDIIGLFYKKNPYTKGVIPAKIFECLAVGKPVLISGLKQDQIYSPYVYHFDGSESGVIEIIYNFRETETKEAIEKRQAVASDTDWHKRFEKFCNIIFDDSAVLPKFSVLMSCYHGDDSRQLFLAMESVINQTVNPDEIVIVCDGPVSEDIEKVIDGYEKLYPEIFKIVRLEKNLGLGLALAEGVKHCGYEIIARTDADDISDHGRFEKQLKFFRANKDIDVVSCYLAAFEDSPEKILFKRRGPQSPEKIARLSRFRFCMNHPAAMFRRTAVERAGSYIAFDGLEDYHLWARMLMNGSNMANIGQVLYYHRWERSLLRRRSGFVRACKQIKLQQEFLKMGFIGHAAFVRNIIVRTAGALLPAGLMRKVRILLGI